MDVKRNGWSLDPSLGGMKARRKKEDRKDGRKEGRTEGRPEGRKGTTTGGREREKGKGKGRGTFLLLCCTMSKSTEDRTKFLGKTFV